MLRAALARWQGAGTEAVIRAPAAIDDPRDRLIRLVDEAFAGDDEASGAHPREPVESVAFTLAVADAAADPIVQPVLRRVSERRIAYLEECFGALGLAPEESRQRAFLAYAAYVGNLRLAREAPDRMPRGEDGRAYRRHLIATLLPSDRPGAAEPR